MDSLKFKGIVCSDWQTISDAKILGHTLMHTKDHGVEHLTIKEKVEKAIHAGIDQFGGEEIPEILVQLAEEGRINEQRINRSIRKLLRLKFQLGLFDNPFVDENRAIEICGSDSFLEKGDESQIRSQVLLKND